MTILALIYPRKNAKLDERVKSTQEKQSRIMLWKKRGAGFARGRPLRHKDPARERRRKKRERAVANFLGRKGEDSI